MTQKFLDHFNRPGIVINVISDAAWRPMRHSLAYNCSKAALDMATKQMARELTKPRDLSIIGVRPGKMTNTAMSAYIDQRVQEVRGWTAEEAMTYFRNNSVSGLEQEPTAVAAFILSIATGGLARNMSGACIDLVG
jgi:NAD(P)-dependent dehydrogenase (short-subunit alcohol dehydrogenase family)